MIAACGGSGTPAGDDTPDTPYVPVDVTPKPVVPPDPVNFVIENTNELGISFAGNRIVVAGVTYDFADLVPASVGDNMNAFVDTTNRRDVGFGLVCMADGNATSVVALVVYRAD